MARATRVVAPPPGLAYRPEFVTVEEERRLLDLLDGLEFHEVRMRGQVARRTVRHFGVAYDYASGGRLAPGEALPPELRWLRDRCAELASVEADRLAQALVSRYPPGAAIGWHRDAPSFGSKVLGVSLLSACRMRFRRGAAGARLVYELELARRSAYVLGGAARAAWQHSIPPVSDLRYSITFRTLRGGRPASSADEA